MSGIDKVFSAISLIFFVVSAVLLYIYCTRKLKYQALKSIILSAFMAYPTANSILLVPEILQKNYKNLPYIICGILIIPIITALDYKFKGKLIEGFLIGYLISLVVGLLQVLI